MNEKTFDVGNLRLVVEHRRFGGDEGPALRVLGEAGGRTVELLRFDCFEREPHYHYAPAGHDERIPINRAEHPDPVAWTLARVRDALPEMVRRAGYPELSQAIPMEAVRELLPDLDAAMRGQG